MMSQLAFTEAHCVPGTVLGALLELTVYNLVAEFKLKSIYF